MLLENAPGVPDKMPNTVGKVKEETRSSNLSGEVFPTRVDISVYKLIVVI